MKNDRKEMRQLFLNAWQKRQSPLSLSPLEQQILSVIEAHKEYESIFDDPDILNKDYRTDNNPFLHMSLHLSLLEQISINQPTEIAQVYQQLLQRYQDEMQVQHGMMECLVETIWQAQRYQQPLDSAAYLQRLQALLQ